jgi:hypothetical protein
MISQYSEIDTQGQFMDLAGFLNFYLHQTLEYPQETRKDLETLGYHPQHFQRLAQKLPEAFSKMAI